MIACGLILVAFWALAFVHSITGSTIALAQFEAAQPSPSGNGHQIDTSLWSPGRIAAFQQAIGIESDPPLAVLRVPRIGLEAPVFRGTDEVTLNRGAGWIEGTAAPGSKGNAGLAAHRDGFFRALKDIATGDVIELETGDGVQHYEVRSTSIVKPTDVSPLAQSSEQALTLVTCHPFYFVGSAPERFIVRATRVEPGANAGARNDAGTEPAASATGRNGD